MTQDLIIRVVKNNQVSDLIVDRDIPLRLDISTVESQELGKFFGIGSQTFNIPGTKEHNRFFEYAYDLSNDKIPGMYNILPCSILLNGDTVLNGSFTLQNIITSEDGFVTYKVQVVDKILQLKDKLSNRLIKDANWSQFDHLLNKDNILLSWNDNLFSGSIFYPLCDYGRDSNTSDNFIDAPLVQLSGSLFGYITSPDTPLSLRQMLPSVRTDVVLDTIIRQGDLTLTGSILEDGTDLTSTYILNKPTNDLGIFSSSGSLDGFNVTSNVSQSITVNEEFFQYDKVNFPIEILDPNNNFNNTLSEYTVPTSGDYTFQYSVNFDVTIPTLDDILVVIELWTLDGSGNRLSQLTPGSNSITLFDTDSGGRFNLSSTFNGSLSSSTKIAVFIKHRINDSISGSPSIVNIVGNLNSFKTILVPDTFLNKPVKIGEQWEPKTKSLDVLKGIITQFNLVLTPNKENKSVINVETFDDWIRRGEIKDWTHKYDTAKRVEISHTVQDLPNELFVKNIDDVDRFSKLTIDNDPGDQYGTLRLLSDSSVTQGTKKIESFFGPIILASNIVFIPSGEKPFEGTYDINLNSPFIIPHLYKWNNKTQESYIFRPRIGYKVKNNLPDPFSQPIYVGTPTDKFQSSLYYTLSNVSNLNVIPGTTKDLHFNNTYPLFTNNFPTLNQGVNSFNRYWKNYLDSLYWEGAKMITLDLYFKPSDFNDINLNDRILIKGQAYRINKIKGFNLSYEDVVTVELIKLFPKYWQT